MDCALVSVVIGCDGCFNGNLTKIKEDARIQVKLVLPSEACHKSDALFVWLLTFVKVSLNQACPPCIHHLTHPTLFSQVCLFTVLHTSHKSC